MIKIGDIVMINVPVGGKAMGTPLQTLYSTRGIIVKMKKIQMMRPRPEYKKWWYVLRSDTSTVEHYHEDWMEVY